MFEDRTRTLLVLPQGVLDDVRVLAGKATTTLKLSVSVQIVLRALVEEGLKRDGHRRLLANIESQAQAVRRIRSLGGRGRRQGLPVGERAEVSEKRGMRVGRAMPVTRGIPAHTGRSRVRRDHRWGSTVEGTP
jgi:hypothetical protein